MHVGSSEEAFAVFMTGPARGVEPAITDLYRDLSVIVGAERYWLRMLVLTRPGDTIRLREYLRGTWEDLMQHLCATGTAVAAAADVLWTDEYGAALVGQHVSRDVLTFLFDDRMHVVRSDPSWLKTVKLYEHKGALVDLWRNRGCLPPSVCVYGETRGEVAPLAAEVWQKLGMKPGRIKVAFSAAGANQEQCRFKSQAELQKLLKDRNLQHVDYVIQQDVGQVDLSVNYYSNGNGEVYHLFCTEQHNDPVNRSAHAGNVQDDRHARTCRLITDQMAVHAAEKGMKGFFGFDLRYDPKQNRAWVIECNARVTAPVYGWVLAMKHNAARFGVTTIKGVTGRSIADVIHPSLWYTPQRGSGIIVHNPGPIEQGVCQVTALAPTQAAVTQLLEAARVSAGATGTQMLFA